MVAQMGAQNGSPKFNSTIDFASNSLRFVASTIETYAFRVDDTHNFEDIVDLFSKNNSCIQLDQKKDIFNAFKTLLNDSKLRDDMAISALNICTDNKGSTKKQYTKILNTIRGAGNETSNSNN
mgnify:CR=1 FL=1